MKEEELKEKIEKGEVEIKETKPPEEPKEFSREPFRFEFNPEDYISILNLMRQIKRPVSTPPTYIPKNFWEQIVFYKNDTTFRVYYYVAKEWKYHTLT